MDETQREVDEIRKERSEVENHIIDEYAAGRLSRRDFVRRGTVIGMSIPMVAFLAAACGGGGEERRRRRDDGAGRHRRRRHRCPGGNNRTAGSRRHVPARIDDAGRHAQPGHRCSTRAASS